LKDWLVNIKEVLDLPISIPEMLGFKAFNVASVLAKTELFTYEEVKNML